MPRIYKPNPLGKRYKKYPNELIKQAVREYNDGVGSLVTVARKFGVNRSVIYRHSTGIIKNHGGQTALSKETEDAIVKFINLCANRIQPLGIYDLRLLVKKYLDQFGITVKKFKDNMPGPDFAANFLKRHNNTLSQSISRRIKRNRAKNIKAKTKIYPSDTSKEYNRFTNTEEEIIETVDQVLEEIKNDHKTQAEKETSDIQGESEASWDEDYIEEYIDDFIEDGPQLDFVSKKELKKSDYKAIKGKGKHVQGTQHCTTRTVPRKCKSNPLGKRYKKYPNDLIERAVREYKNGVGTLVAISQKFGINKSVLYRHSTRSMKTHGGQTALSKETEEAIVKFINLSADRVHPFGLYELRRSVKKYLDQSGSKVKRFKDNMPGPDFAENFLSRHKNTISKNILRHMRKNRAKNINTKTVMRALRPLTKLNNFQNVTKEEDTEAVNKIYLEVLDEINSDCEVKSERGEENYVQAENESSCNGYFEEYIDSDIDSIPELTFVSVQQKHIKSTNKVIKRDIGKGSKQVQCNKCKCNNKSDSQTNEISELITRCLSNISSGKINSVYIIIT